MAKSSDAIHNEIIDLLPALKIFARRFYFSSHDVDDLVQDTLVKAVASMHTFTPGTRLKSWLFTIMRNTFYNRYRRDKREVSILDNDSGLMATVQPEQEWSIQHAQVMTAIEHLPRHYRNALCDVVFEDLSYEQAADKNQCAVGTVKSRVSRARMKLTEMTV